MHVLLVTSHLFAWWCEWDCGYGCVWFVPTPDPDSCSIRWSVLFILLCDAFCLFLLCVRCSPAGGTTGRVTTDRATVVAAAGATGVSSSNVRARAFVAGWLRAHPDEAWELMTEILHL